MTEHASQSQALVRRVRQRFADEFGDGEPEVFFAPGRINLIGAHLDYSGGDVLPLAVDLGVYVAARPAATGRIRLRSLDRPEAVDVAIDEIGETRRAEQHWAAYPLGVWREFRAATDIEAGVDLVFAGDLPIASGMSSSAAMEVATAFALDALHGTGLPAEAIARLGYRAENGFVGLKCGIMDQFASALARSGHALLLHCHDATWEHVPIRGDGFEILVMDSRKPRTLWTSVFNDRVRECAEAYDALRVTVGERPCLAAYTEADVEAAKDALGPVQRRRALHVVREMRRVATAVIALRSGDWTGLGAALTESHRSTSELYDVSCAELDHLTELACARPGVFGARLTGAGFGGCAIALIEPGAASDVVGPIREAYRARFGIDPGFMVLHAGGGPRRV